MASKQRPNGLMWLSPSMATLDGGLTLVRLNGTVDVYDANGGLLVCAAATVEDALAALRPSLEAAA